MSKQSKADLNASAPADLVDQRLDMSREELSELFGIQLGTPPAPAPERSANECARAEWERDLSAAFLHLAHGVGAAPAHPVDFSSHPIFALLHARWLHGQRHPPKEDQP
jgi:hypothetical protein